LDLVPIFVPVSFLGPQWPGPYWLFRAEGIGLTWTVLGEGMVVRCLDRAMQQHWEQQGIDWRTVALENLKRRSSGEHPFATHSLGEDPKHPFAVAMMNPDGIGPSRLLLKDVLQRIFPQGHRFAMPEMSCGLAFALTL